MGLTISFNASAAGVSQIAPKNDSPVLEVEKSKDGPQQAKQSPKLGQMAMMVNSKQGSPLFGVQFAAEAVSSNDVSASNVQSTGEVKDAKSSFDPKPTPEQEKSEQEVVDKWGSAHLDAYLNPTYNHKDVDKMVSDMITKIQTQLGRPLSNDEVKQLTEDAISGLFKDKCNSYQNPGEQNPLGFDGVEKQIVDKWTGVPPPAPSPLTPAQEKAIEKYAKEYGVNPDDLRKYVEEVDKRASDELKQQKKSDSPVHCQDWQIANIARAMRDNDMDGMIDDQVANLVALS